MRAHLSAQMRARRWGTRVLRGRREFGKRQFERAKEGVEGEGQEEGEEGVGDEDASEEEDAGGGEEEESGVQGGGGVESSAGPGVAEEGEAENGEGEGEVYGEGGW